jgi:hypothetical protein
MARRSRRAASRVGEPELGEKWGVDQALKTAPTKVLRLPDQLDDGAYG